MVDIDVREQDGVQYAEISGPSRALAGTADVLRLMDELAAHRGLQRVLLHRAVLDEGTFDLRSGFAGQLVEALKSHSMKLAVVGDFKLYENLALKAFLLEGKLNKIAHFGGDRGKALRWLVEA